MHFFSCILAPPLYCTDVCVFYVFCVSSFPFYFFVLFHRLFVYCRSAAFCLSLSTQPLEVILVESCACLMTNSEYTFFVCTCRILNNAYMSRRWWFAGVVCSLCLLCCCRSANYTKNGMRWKLLIAAAIIFGVWDWDLHIFEKVRTAVAVAVHVRDDRVLVWVCRVGNLQPWRVGLKSCKFGALAW